MNRPEDDELFGTTYGGNYVWSRSNNGSYTQILRVYYKNGKYTDTIIREHISEQEYFKCKLDGTA